MLTIKRGRIVSQYEVPYMKTKHHNDRYINFSKSESSFAFSHIFLMHFFFIVDDMFIRKTRLQKVAKHHYTVYIGPNVAT